MPVTKIPLERPVRRRPPPVPSEPVRLAAPPAEQGPTGGHGWQSILPALGSVGALAFVATNPQPITILAGGLFAVAGIAGAIAMAIGSHRQRYRERDRQRAVYLDYLQGAANEATKTAEAQRGSLDWRHPPPPALAGVARTPERVWERRIHDPDFLEIRLGLGDQPLTAPLEPWPEPEPLTVLDPVLVAAGRDVLRRHERVTGVPVTVDLREVGGVTVVGDDERSRALVCAIVGELATFHSPGDLGLEVDCDAERAGHWSWLDWLPHTEARTEPPWSARVVDRDDRIGIDVVGPLDSPGRIGAVVTLKNGAATLETGDDTAPFEPDAVSEIAADALARSLAPLVLVGDEPEPVGEGDAVTAPIDLPQLLGIEDLRTVDIAALWAPRPVERLVRVAFAVDERGAPVDLDLKEAALGGVGPHGLMIGATGSGKSEALRTMVLGLALRHPPELVSFVLVDFKGGAAFAGLSELPHVAGLITNLADDTALVDRMHDALFGELRRRQELLRATGNLASVWEYRERRAAQPDLAALPNLLVVIDEFGELLAAKPEFVELFNAIGRLGRSLGIHLLFASQRLDEGRLRGLEGHLSYRIALRTFNASESRTVIGSDDAFKLPKMPGVGLLAEPDGLLRFRVAMSSKPYEGPAEVAPVAPEPPPVEPRRLSDPVSVREMVEPATNSRTKAEDRPTMLDELVDRIVAHGAPATHSVWLPPLPASLTIDQLLGELTTTDERGLHAAAVPPSSMVAPYGLVDLPELQRQEIAVHDFTGVGSNMVVVGAPQSGKSSLLRAIVAGLALTHTPREIQIYAIDLGGGGLEAVAALPHVGGVAGRSDPERVSRIVRETVNLVAAREQLFSRSGLDGIAAYRVRRAAGDFADERYGDVFVVIDNWAAFRTEFEELEQPVTELAGRAAGYGVHFIVSANRSNDLRLNLKDLFGGRIELHLADSSDSEIDRRAAARLPTRPGRALIAGGSQVQVALARIDGRADATTAADGARDLADRVAEAWLAPTAPPVNLLPVSVALDDITDAGVVERGLPIGVAETDLQPIGLDLFGTEPHLLVFGETASGKTALLRTLAVAMIRRYTPEQVRFLVVDPRRRLLGELPDEYLAAYCPTAPAMEQAVSRLATTMAEREPPADVTVEQLRNRSWWLGPEIVVLVDDYELVANARDNPLTHLAEWLPQAVDLGLHVVLARRTGGASRSMYDPVIQQIIELGEQGILLSGDPGEGPLLGNMRPVPQPAGRGILVRRRESPVVVQLALAAA
jgi:S-DNA-T family DNA segregation ATPase FtsK/SpoIIIE